MKEYYEYKIEQINNELSLLEPFIGTLPEEENKSLNFYIEGLRLKLKMYQDFLKEETNKKIGVIVKK